jgi:hypothetical protein
VGFDGGFAHESGGRHFGVGGAGLDVQADLLGLDQLRDQTDFILSGVF